MEDERQRVGRRYTDTHPGHRDANAPAECTRVVVGREQDGNQIADFDRALRLYGRIPLEAPGRRLLTE
jgi:hypothetical protein